MTNICANERKYCNRPFTDTYKQKKHRTHTTHTKDQQTTFYTYTRTIINTSKHIIADKIQNIAQKIENTQSICHGNHMYEKYSDYHDVHIQYRLNTRCTHRKCNPSVISSNNNTKDTKYIAKHRETQGQAAVNTHTHTHSSQGTCPLQARMRAISGSGSGNQATWRPPRTRAQPVTLVSFSYGRWFEVSAIQQQQIWLSAQPRRDAMTTTTKSQHRLTFECFWMLLRKEPNTETQ